MLWWWGSVAIALWGITLGITLGWRTGLDLTRVVWLRWCLSVVVVGRVAILRLAVLRLAILRLTILRLAILRLAILRLAVLIGVVHDVVDRIGMYRV